MKKTLTLIVCTLCFVGMVKAQEEPYGPYPNFKGTEPATAIVTIPTTSDVWLDDGLGHTYHIKSQGGQEFEIHYTSPIFVDSYAYPVHPPERPFDPDLDYLILTEIFAYDLQPSLDPNLVPNQRGFNPTNPEIWPIGTSGRFIGQSGTVYSVPLEILTVGQLAARLPGYDVSKIQPPLSNKVFLLQGTVPGFDFVEKPFEFSYEYRGVIDQLDPDWRGPKNPQYPFQHKWELLITNWSDVNMISDLEVEQPWVIYPGYIEIVPPTDWHDTGVTIGRYGYEANPGSEIQVGGGSLGVEWRVNGKVPAVDPGVVYLTTKKIPVSKIMPAMVPDNPDAHCGDWGYRDADLNKDCYVNFADLALFALDWLKCSDPQGQDCSPNSIIGLGFGFNAEDSNYPATIVYLLDPDATPGLDVNDIIVEYQGITIYSGAQLLGVFVAGGVVVGNGGGDGRERNSRGGRISRSGGEGYGVACGRVVQPDKASIEKAISIGLNRT